MQVEEQEYDEVIVNLKVIASLKVNTKVSTTGSFLNIEADKYIPESVRRWWRNDNRDESIRKIDRIVMKAITYLDGKKGKKEIITESLINARTGLMNLKETYGTCIQTCARLETIVDKINTNAVIIEIEKIEE